MPGLSIQRRNRMERIQARNDYEAYAMGQMDLKWRHCTYELIAEKVLQHYDRANERLKGRNVFD